MVDAITDRTRLIVICNPNNPTGTVLSQDRLREFVDAVPPDCLMALDEAYHEYVRHPGVPDGRSLLAGRPNLVVLRTFSKAYGLAGLRVGYLMGDDHVVSQLRKACLPFSLSRVAQAAARTALRVRDRLFERVEATVAERTRVRDALLAAGWKIPRSEANFLWLRLGERSTGFGRWCAAAGVEVRTFPGEGVRVSIGSPEDNDAFLAVVAGWRAGAREGSAC
jgi:histidinol-phosphate aminotransferase